MKHSISHTFNVSHDLQQTLINNFRALNKKSINIFAIFATKHLNHPQNEVVESEAGSALVFQLASMESKKSNSGVSRS